MKTILFLSHLISAELLIMVYLFEHKQLTPTTYAREGTVGVLKLTKLEPRQSPH